MENRRILITKQLLCESFISLLKQKPIDKISVTELCQAANVNRGSFYAHYADVYDLLGQIESIVYERLCDAVRNCNYTKSDFPRINKIIETVEAERSFCDAQSKYGANDPQAIIGMVMKVFTIAVNLAVGISAGCQPIFGFNYGAGRYDRVRKLLAWSCGACCASASLQQFYSRRSQRRSSAFSGQIHRTRRSIWNLAQGRCASICC